MRLSTFGLLSGLALTAVACGSDRTTAPATRLDGAFTQGGATIVTTVACGETVVADLRLEDDLTCPADGLIVGGDGIKINLNGHTITGAGVGLGINVRGRQDVVIYGGTVQGFLTGVMVATSSGVVIKDNAFTQNREAVFLAGSSGNTIKNNSAWDNSMRGIMIRPTGSGVISTDNVVMDNVLTNNPSGILLFGQPGNMIKGNAISQSSVAGFDLLGGGAADNVFKDNVLSSSAVGIKFGPGWTGNTFVGNTIQSNTCGTQGTSTGNVFKENLFVANVTDLCP